MAELVLQLLNVTPVNLCIVCAIGRSAAFPLEGVMERVPSAKGKRVGKGNPELKIGRVCEVYESHLYLSTPTGVFRCVSGNHSYFSQDLLHRVVKVRGKSTSRFQGTW